MKLLSLLHNLKLYISASINLVLLVVSFSSCAVPEDESYIQEKHHTSDIKITWKSKSYCHYYIPKEYQSNFFRKIRYVDSIVKSYDNEIALLSHLSEEENDNGQNMDQLIQNSMQMNSLLYKRDDDYILRRREMLDSLNVLWLNCRSCVTKRTYRYIVDGDTISSKKEITLVFDDDKNLIGELDSTYIERMKYAVSVVGKIADKAIGAGHFFDKSQDVIDHVENLPIIKDLKVEITTVY